MDITRFEIPGLALVKPRIFEDGRGFFTERFRVDQWREAFPDTRDLIQDNFSFSKQGVLRGLHFQFSPNQAKLVTCTSGVMTDVVVDIRPDSPTLGKHIQVELSARDPRWLWIPAGFAHGFVATSPEGAGILYKVDELYHPQAEGSIAWNDPDLAIKWPFAKPVLSPKDEASGSFQQYLKSDFYKNFKF